MPVAEKVGYLMLALAAPNTFALFPLPTNLEKLIGSFMLFETTLSILETHTVIKLSETEKTTSCNLAKL